MHIYNKKTFSNWEGIRHVFYCTEKSKCPRWLSLRCPPAPGALSTGKYLSEALIFASKNPQYDDRLFIELQVQYMKIASSEHVIYTNCFFVFVLTFRTIFVHNMF